MFIENIEVFYSPQKSVRTSIIYRRSCDLVLYIEGLVVFYSLHKHMKDIEVFDFLKTSKFNIQKHHNM